MTKHHQIYSNRWFTVAPTGDKRSWAPRGAERSPSKEPARHEVGQCLGTWGTGESNQRNWHRQHQPFPRIGPARSFGETRSCNKGWSLDFGNTGLGTCCPGLCDYQQTIWKWCPDPSECLNTFVDVGVGVSVLLFPFHAGGKISLPYLTHWRRQTRSGVPMLSEMLPLFLGGAGASLLNSKETTHSRVSIPAWVPHMTLQAPGQQRTSHTEAVTETQAEHCSPEEIINP